MLLSIIRFLRVFATKLRDDSVSAFAAQAAFFIILSVFPFLMFLLTLLKFIPFSLNELEVYFSDFFPRVISASLSKIAAEVSERASGTLISVTVIAALWSASRGTLALSRGLNSVYGYRETRNYFVIRGISALYTLVFAILLIASLLLLVFGNQLYGVILNYLPFLSDFAFLLLSMRSMLTLLFLTLFFLMIYMVIPNRKSSLLSELPGAFVSSCGWLGFSYLFSFYIDHMGDFSYTYGSLTVVAVSMLWLYFCMYILFIGAEVNMALTNRGRQALSPYKNAIKSRQRSIPRPPDASHRTDSFQHRDHSLLR